MASDLKALETRIRNYIGGALQGASVQGAALDWRTAADNCADEIIRWVADAVEDATSAALAGAEQATTDARRSERTAVVAWLRKAQEAGRAVNEGAIAASFSIAANVITRGEHAEALAADVPAAADHDHPGGYLSTACLHGLCEPECGAAQRARGYVGHPTCKFCKAKCTHSCHTGGQVERAERVHADGCTLAADDPHHSSWCKLPDAVPAAGEAEVTP